MIWRVGEGRKGLRPINDPGDRLHCGPAPFSLEARQQIRRAPVRLHLGMPSGIPSRMASRVDMEDAQNKVLENRLRRLAKRRGLALQKSRRRDPDATDFGGFMLVDANTGAIAAGGEPAPFSFDLRSIEIWLTRRSRPVAPRILDLASKVRHDISVYEALILEWRAHGVAPDNADDVSKQLAATEKFLEQSRSYLALMAEDGGRAPTFTAKS